MSTPTVAIVGASTNRSKFGNKSVRAHAACGWQVFPIHPTADEIEGHQAYPNVNEVPGKITRISLYLPDQVAAQLAADFASVDADELYVNPGAGGPLFTEALATHSVRNVRYACSIVELGVSPADFPD